MPFKHPRKPGIAGTTTCLANPSLLNSKIDISCLASPWPNGTYISRGGVDFTHPAAEQTSRAMTILTNSHNARKAFVHLIQRKPMPLFFLN
jgi:hypothetical protein